MMDALKRKLGLIPETATAEKLEEDLTMDNTTNEALAAALAQDVAGLQATVTNLTSQLTESQSKIAELNALVTAAADFQVAQEKAALDTKLAARFKEIEATVGTEKASALMAATTSLDDSAFSAVVNAMKVAGTTEANTSLFSEQGVDAEVDPTKLAANGVEDILRAKYQTVTTK